MNEHKLNGLFELAANETPRLSLTQAEFTFASSLALSAGSSLAYWKKLLTLKNGMMMMTVTGVITASLMFMNAGDGPELAMASVVDTQEDRIEAPVELKEELLVEEAIPMPDPLQEVQTWDLHADDELTTPPEPVIPKEPKGAEDGNLPAEQETAPSTQDEFDTPEEEDEYQAGPDMLILFDRSASSGDHDVIVFDQFKGDSTDTEETWPQRISFNISTNTTEEDLAQILKVAGEAGIATNYNGMFKRGRIKYIDIELYINDGTEDGIQSSIIISVKGREQFSTNLVWRVDKNGKAIDFDRPVHQHQQQRKRCASSCN